MHNDDNEAEAHYVFNTSVSSDPGEPKQYRDAVKPGPERKFWVDSIKSEILNFTSRQVWKKFPRFRAKWTEASQIKMGV